MKKRRIKVNKELYLNKINIFALLLLYSFANSQGNPRAALLEIFFQNTDTVYAAYVEDEAQSTIWDSGKMITGQFQSGSFTVPKGYSGLNIGFNYVYVTHPPDGATDWATLGYGKYKITIDIWGSFYLDLRDANQTDPIDIYMKYDRNRDLLWKWFGACNSDTTMNWEEISPGSTKTIWGMFDGCGDWTETQPYTAPFQPINPSNLTGSINGGNHPVLNWDASDEPPWVTIHY